MTMLLFCLMSRVLAVTKLGLFRVHIVGDFVAVIFLHPPRVITTLTLDSVISRFNRGIFKA